MENGLEIDAHRAVIRVGFHNVSHEIPPFPVDGRIGSLCPALFVFDINIAELGQCFSVQKDRIILSAVFMDHILHFRPELIMAFFVFCFLSFIKFHFKSFDHRKTLPVFLVLHGMIRKKVLYSHYKALRFQLQFLFQMKYSIVCSLVSAVLSLNNSTASLSS